MASISVKLSQSQLDDIDVVRRLGAGRLNALADALERMNPTIRRSELRRVITDIAGAESATAIRRVLVGLAFAIRTRRIPPTDLFKAIGEALRSQGWSPDDMLLWHECSPVVERLVTSPAVVLTTKARDLAEDFERALTSARILTDIRPVYNDTDDVIGAEVIQTLRIEYDSVSRQNADNISFALDLEDIKQLQIACERALKKAESARELLRVQLGDEILMIGA